VGEQMVYNPNLYLREVFSIKAPWSLIYVKCPRSRIEYFMNKDFKLHGNESTIFLKE